MPKARFTFNQDGSIEIIKGERSVILGIREVKVLMENFEKTQLAASQIGLSHDFIKYPYKIH
jgi:hypothetical protein